MPAMVQSLRRYISARLRRAVFWSGLLAGAGVIVSGSFLINRIVVNATETAYRDVENRVAILDHALARVERDSAETGHLALLKLAAKYPTLADARDAGIDGLRRQAAQLSISEIYFISLHGVILATSFEPDQDFDLYALGTDFRNFLLDLVGKGRFADQRLSMSTNTSQVNSYQYYGPPGADYILEVSTRLDESVPRTYTGLALDELLKLLLNNDGESTGALVHVSDFIWGKNQPFRSFITQKPVDEHVSALIARAAKDGTAYSNAGMRQTIVRSLSLSERDFDYSDKYTFMVLVADRTPVLVFTLVSAAVSFVLIAMAIAGSYYLARGSFDRHVTSRIEALETAMSRIGSGDAGVMLDDGCGDEIAGIGRCAEAMVTQIRERNAELSALARKLEEEANEGARREIFLTEALDANQALVHEIDHRVKNNLQIAISLASMQSETSRSDETRMALDRMRMRLAVMAMVQDQALRSPDSPIVDMTQFLQDVAANVAASHQETCQRIERRVSSADCPFAPDRAVALGLAAAELIDNAYRHAFASVDSGVLTITLDDDGCAGSFRLVVEDDGEGEPKPGGVGLEIVEALASQLGGSVSWTTSAGTRVELSGGPGA
ncbi:MAG: hypothetical protein CVV51_00450 [Spirochaetae bacterium HGW-Spirochaetae-7]|nr:MAG: hypothetical protein CVV51_00450 [Spirochaetae bacterium HGW-Spirochaetae-7]